jgi:vacuolar-type H+-ATPase subunit H
MDNEESPAHREALVARAMDRALESERAAQVAIAECEQQAADVLEHARQQRRTILERAQARIVALHTRAASNLEQRTADIAAKRVQSATAVVEQLSEPARRTKALERLAARLTTDEAEPARDDR